MANELNLTAYRHTGLRYSVWFFPLSGVPANVNGITASLKVKKDIFKDAVAFELTEVDGIDLSISVDPRDNVTPAVKLTFQIEPGDLADFESDLASYSLTFNMGSQDEPLLFGNMTLSWEVF